MNRKSNRWRFVVGIGFVIVGLLLLFYPQIERVVSSAEQKQLIDAFEQLGTLELDELIAENEIEQLEERPILKDARGIIRIPTIDAELMIFESILETALSRGVGMIEPDKEIGKNNVGLAGHRAIAHGKLFNRLDELKENDTLFVQTKTNSYEFTVVETFVVDRTEIDVLQDKPEPYLTLVTCTPVGAKLPTDRLIVQAKLTRSDVIK